MAKGASAKTIVQAVGETPKIETAIVDLSFASADTYKTGGFTITPANVKLSAILAVVATGCAGYHVSWSAGKLQLFKQSNGNGALTEIADATDISAISPIRLIVFGYK